MDHTAKIKELLQERAHILKGEWRSQCEEYRRVSNLISYYRNHSNRRAWARANNERSAECARTRYTFDPDYRAQALQRNKTWREKNPGALAALNRKRREKNPQAKIADRLRSWLRAVGLRPDSIGSVRGRKPIHDFVALVGCTRAAFRAHIESQFQNGMSWANKGTHWELDHHQPLSSFDLTDEATHPVALHYTNIRVVTRLQNLSKGYKVPLELSGQ